MRIFLKAVTLAAVTVVVLVLAGMGWILPAILIGYVAFNEAFGTDDKCKW